MSTVGTEKTERRYGHRGFAAIAIVLLFSCVFALMTAGVGDSVNLGLHNTNRIAIQHRTKYAAYGGVQEAMDLLAWNTTYNTGTALNSTSVSVPGDSDLIYNVSVFNNLQGTTAVTAPDGTNIPPNMVYMLSEADLAANPGVYASGMSAICFIGCFNFTFSVIATQGVAMNNSSTSSFGWSGTANKFFYDNTGFGRVGTNGLVVGEPGGYPSALNITNNSCINGAAYLGPNATISLGLNQDASSTITNSPVQISTAMLHVPRFCPPFFPGNATAATMVSPPDGTSITLQPGPPGYYGLNATNCNITIGQGNYYFANNVTLNNCQLVVNSSATAANSSLGTNTSADLYVGSTVTVSNTLWNMDRAPNTTVAAYQNANGGPTTCRIFFVGNGAPGYKSLNLMAQNSYLCTVADGKALNTTLVNTSMWGSIYASSVTMTDSNVSFYTTASLFPQLARTAMSFQTFQNNDQSAAGMTSISVPGS